MAGEGIRFELLPWDSERFGFSVARVRDSVSPADLTAVIEQLRQRRVVLAYYGVSDSCPGISEQDEARLGARLVDTRIVFRKGLDSRVVREDAILTVRSIQTHAVGPTLIELARSAGRYSRFRVDPRIDPKVFHAIYDAWLIRSVRREIADDVFVGSVGGEDVGLVTVSASQSDASIGLLSISEAVRGRGFGRAMTEHAFGWAADRGCRALRVVTQVANAPACALYASLGCSVESRERTYHIWLA